MLKTSTGAVLHHGDIIALKQMLANPAPSIRRVAADLIQELGLAVGLFAKLA